MMSIESSLRSCFRTLTVLGRLRPDRDAAVNTRSKNLPKRLDLDGTQIYIVNRSGERPSVSGSEARLGDHVMKGFLASAAVAAAMVAACGAANATIYDFTYTEQVPGGAIPSIPNNPATLDVTASGTLDVNGSGVAVSGSGTITSPWFTGESLTLLAPGTYEFGDGTVLGASDNVVRPGLTINGLIFQVGSTPWSQGLGFTFSASLDGSADAYFMAGKYPTHTGTTFYNGDYSGNGNGVFTLTAVPEASTWAMLGLGFAALGLAGFRRARTPRAVAL
jgi:hypothetical protein